jgi:hypothetical protein
VSALRIRLQALMQRHVSHGATSLEDWLLDVANARGATFVRRVRDDSRPFDPPGEDVVSNENLAVAIRLVAEKIILVGDRHVTVPMDILQRKCSL